MPRKPTPGTVGSLSAEEIAAVEAWLDDLERVLEAWASDRAPSRDALRSWALRAGWAREAPHGPTQIEASRERLNDVRTKRRQLGPSVRVPDGCVRCWARYALPGYSDPRANRRANMPEIDDLRAAWRRDPSVPRFMPSRKVLMREAWLAMSEALAAVERGRRAPRGAAIFSWIREHRALVPIRTATGVEWLSDATPRNELVDAIEALALVYDVYDKSCDGALDGAALRADVDACLIAGGETLEKLASLAVGRFDVTWETVRDASRGVVGARARLSRLRTVSPTPRGKARR